MIRSNYKVKVVKAKGTCGIYADSRISKKYYSIVIKDATACCSQGLEFVLKDSWNVAAKQWFDLLVSEAKND